MILTGPEIRRQVELGSIEIDPFVPEHVNPASVDLTLGDEYLVYTVPDTKIWAVLGINPEVMRDRELVLDTRKKNSIARKAIGSNGAILYPGILYLMHTVEVLHTVKHVTVIDGKSSLARLGIVTHLTAGYGDVGFRGQYTLEVTAVHPVRVYAGMRFCQARFHALEGEIEQYAGNYSGEIARGPVASRSWRQFK